MTILKLPDCTIKKIAAGEVITRPINVIKELLENSLDAGSTNIRLKIEQGGLKLIEIYDNGHGIAQEDAKLLCRRHATSKISSAADLTKIDTFGFRGEALASISEMADVQVKSFNISVDKKGWQATYKDGELVGEPLDTYLQFSGTYLRITNLFSGIQQRKTSLQTTFCEEKKAICDLVTRYVIQNRDKVTISLKETNCQDMICFLAPMSMKSVFGLFFGLEMESNLIEFDLQETETFKVDAHIAISHKKHSAPSKTFNFILFVNDRLVECQDLKKEIETLTCEFPSFKQSALVAFINLKVPPCDVDVNVHPSKATVALHFQTEIIALIIKSLRDFLKKELDHLVVYPTASQKPVFKLTMSPENSELSLTNRNSTPIRTNRLELLAPGSLKKNLPEVHTSSAVVKRQYDLIHSDSTQRSLKQMSPLQKHSTREMKLRSIHELRQQVGKEKAGDNAKIIKNSVFVGLFDHYRALIQHDTKLYAINFKAYLKEQYYQFFLFDFANFPAIEILPPSNKIKFLVDTYLDDVKKHDTTIYESLTFNTADSIISELTKHSKMFEDYLTLKITKDAIVSIPCIIPDEIPNLVFLGKFLVELVNKVDFSKERECFRMIGRLIADFYSEPPANLKDKEVHRGFHERIETKLYAAIKEYLIIPEWLFTKENICQISDTKDLYKVFERC